MKRLSIQLVALLFSLGATAGNYKGVDMQMTRMDANKDGKISLEEFTEARQRQREEAGLKFIPKITATAFKTTDKNKDGYLSRTELANSETKSNKGNSEKEASIFIRSRDADKDGRVSQEEYLDTARKKRKSGGENFTPNIAKNKFDSMDQNGDGYLDQEEVEKEKK